MLDIGLDKKTLVLFDMDGVLAEYKWGENDLIRGGDTEVYMNKRPIYTVIEYAKCLVEKGVSVGILSSCNTSEQKDAKLTWLANNAPFITDDIYILVWSELDLVGDDKNYAKARLIQTIVGYDTIYLIDDKHKIIDATNAVIPNCAHHVSEIIR